MSKIFVKIEFSDLRQFIVRMLLSYYHNTKKNLSIAKSVCLIHLNRVYFMLITVYSNKNPIDFKFRSSCVILVTYSHIFFPEYNGMNYIYYELLI